MTVIEIVDKDGVVYHLSAESPCSDIDRRAPWLSVANQRVLEIIKDAPGLKRPPRLIQT